VLTGGDEIVRELEERGYDWIKERYGAPEPEPVPAGTGASRAAHA
jgi:Fe-S cluster assembly ATP-binding protein